MPTMRKHRRKRRQAGLTLDQALSLQVGWTLFERRPFVSDAARRQAWQEYRARCEEFEPGDDFDPFGRPRTPGTRPRAAIDYEEGD